jgi:hypothetical protein
VCTTLHFLLYYLVDPNIIPLQRITFHTLSHYKIFITLENNVYDYTTRWLQPYASITLARTERNSCLNPVWRTRQKSTVRSGIHPIIRGSYACCRAHTPAVDWDRPKLTLGRPMWTFFTFGGTRGKLYNYFNPLKPKHV